MDTREKEHTEICCIGHITHDKIVTPRSTVHLPGGTAYYFGHAMAGIGAKDFRLVTSLAAADLAAVDELRDAGVTVDVIPSSMTVCFENIYGTDTNHRTQRVTAKADPFTVDKLADVKGDIFHLGTLLADDFSTEVLRELSRRGRVSVDAQGYLREVVGNDVRAVDWLDKEEAFRYIDILKANEHEMEVLTGSTDPSEAAARLAAMGIDEVVITLGSEGSMILSEGKEHHISAFPPRDVVDATGCGDTYMAGYLYCRSIGKGIEESGHYAAAMCTLKLEGNGPFRGCGKDVEEVLEGRKQL
ncbi:MAG: ribokinase [Muribaculaceae bacterium]|nr:ribokinase [Muribaculaceae bacterium]